VRKWKGRGKAGALPPPRTYYGCHRSGCENTSCSCIQKNPCLRKGEEERGKGQSAARTLTSVSQPIPLYDDNVNYILLFALVNGCNTVSAEGKEERGGRGSTKYKETITHTRTKKDKRHPPTGVGIHGEKQQQQRTNKQKMMRGEENKTKDKGRELREGVTGPSFLRCLRNSFYNISTTRKTRRTEINPAKQKVHLEKQKEG
jgi:hypothetical protein